MRIVRFAGLMLLAAATTYALYRVVYLPLHCARAASIVAAAVETNPTPRTAARVRDALRPCECVRDREAHIDFILGGVSTALGDDRAAIAAYQRALTIERRPELYFALGMAQLRALDRAAAIESLARACAFDPAWLAEIPYPDVREEVRTRQSSAPASS